VKLYEYAALGIPVVATNMPELIGLPEQIVKIANNAEMFSRSIIDQVDNNSVKNIKSRVKWAEQNDWSHRFEQIEKLISGKIHSIIVLAYGDAEVTSKCVEAIVDNCDTARTELIIIDNGSTDGIKDLINRVSKLFKHFKYRKTFTNIGYARGMNYGIRLSTGSYVTLMNNDVTIGTGWQSTVERYINKNREIGAVCPLTDNCGNEAAVDFIEYNNEFWDNNKLNFEIENTGMYFEVKTLGFFNVTLSREAIEICGELSEDYGLGMFEDDDYCRKLEKSGFKRIIILDSVVRHAMSKNFDNLDPSYKKELFAKNKKRYEEKWGRWIPHTYLVPKLDIDQFNNNRDNIKIKEIVNSHKYKFYRYGDLVNEIID
jgi:GT2 family glycosyltransferase